MSQLSYPPPFRPLGDEEVSIDEEPVDTGLIRCICDSTEDDGFTIQCDKCLTWQHAFCMKINSKNIPDRYLCSLCDKRPVPSNAGMHKKRPVSKPSGANSTTTTTTPSTSNASTPINAVTKRTTRTDDEYKTVKKPKLSKRIAVPKSQMDRSALYDHSNNQHHQLHHAHSPQNDPSESGSVSRASSPRPAARKRFHHTASTHVCSKFVRQVLHEATEKWARHPKWRSAPWRPSDQQEESLLQMEPFTVVDASSFGAPTPFALKPVPKPGAHRVASKLKKGAFADTQLYANTFLIEAHGDLLLKSEFKFDAANDYALLGTPCAHVLFYPTLDLCMDARHRGNDARHFRRSCHPNAEIRVMVCPSSMASNANANSSSSSSASASSSTSHSSHSSNNNTRIVRLGIFTRSVIQPNEEITLGWHWQKGHVAWRKHVEWVRSSQDDFHPRDDELAMDEAAAPHLRAAMDAMLQRFEAEFGDCACGDRDVCLIDRLRQECYQSGVVTTPTTTPQGSFRHHRPTSVSRQTSTGSIEKTGTTIAHAPAPTSMSLVPPSISATSAAAAAIADENIDVDVISMSPSAANTPKKDATDDEGDIDIDIGDDLPTSSTAIEDNDDEKKTKAALPFKKAWARHYQKQGKKK
ncbi:hypothetical protein BC940DRAFT_36943 [Gongronella butleri]|nr:hypothetical protein BC940DRAFT_36943 [Gongronella butleri]